MTTIKQSTPLPEHYEILESYKDDSLDIIEYRYLKLMRLYMAILKTKESKVEKDKVYNIIWEISDAYGIIKDKFNAFEELQAKHEEQQKKLEEMERQREREKLMKAKEDKERQQKRYERQKQEQAQQQAKEKEELQQPTKESITTDKTFMCVCGNTYKNRQHLYRHRSSCSDHIQINKRV